jgi:C4-dicarboxylate transporter, DctM subunit
MTSDLVAGGAITLLVVLILAEVPVAFALIISGFIGIAFLVGPYVAFSTISSAPYTAVAKYDFIILPMFLLLGALVANAGIATRIFASANYLVGRLPGGLGITTVLACTVFGGISGSSVADAATLGRVAIGEMRSHGYGARFSAGLVAASGMIAILIPPSIPLVMYGILTGIPIGALLLAGILPGILSAFLFSAYVVAHHLFVRGRTATRTQRNGTSSKETPLSAVRHKLTGLIYAGILFAVVVGGIYLGVLTATEAAAAGAFVSLFMAFGICISDGLGIAKVIRESMLETARTTAMIFALLVGSTVFSYLLAYSQVPNELARWAVSLDWSPQVLVLCFLLILVPLGMFLDGLSILLLTIPVAFPIISLLGVDGLWFGILVITMIELGLITPPVGLNVYVVSAVVRDISVDQVFLGASPFIVLQLTITGILFLFPEIVTVLPRMAGYI